MNAVEKHPQRQQIIDGILAGEQLQHISARVQPPIHRTTLSRYRQVLLQSATRTMKGAGQTNRVLKDLAASSSSQINGPERLREELHERIINTESRLDRWILAAESETDPETGEKRFNHRALGLHTRNGLSAIELRAKLAGLLQESATACIQISIGIVETSGEQSAECIDIGETR